MQTCPMRVHFVQSANIREPIESLFFSEKAKLQEMLPSATIEHVGGSAVPGLLTKGDLDICVQVREEDFQNAAHVLKRTYEINQPHHWTRTYASFKDDSRDIGVQLCVRGSADDYFVRQREYLLNNPNAVEKLNDLKQRFEGAEMEAYRLAKNNFYETLDL